MLSHSEVCMMVSYPTFVDAGFSCILSSCFLIVTSGSIIHCVSET